MNTILKLSILASILLHGVFLIGTIFFWRSINDLKLSEVKMYSKNQIEGIYFEAHSVVDVEESTVTNFTNSTEATNSKVVQNQLRIRNDNRVNHSRTSLRISSVKSLSASELGLSVVYPKLSRTLGEEGRVVIIIKSSETDTQIMVAVSSGYSRLDQAALHATHRAYKQGIIKSQFLANQDLEIPYVFELSDNSR